MRLRDSRWCPTQVDRRSGIMIQPPLLIKPLLPTQMLMMACRDTAHMTRVMILIIDRCSPRLRMCLRCLAHRHKATHRMAHSSSVLTNFVLMTTQALRLWFFGDLLPQLHSEKTIRHHILLGATKIPRIGKSPCHRLMVGAIPEVPQTTRITITMVKAIIRATRLI